MKYNTREQRVELDDNWEENFLAIGGQDFFLENLEGGSSRRGGNSSVFKAIDESGETTLVVKFCRYPLNSQIPFERRRVGRFFREIKALDDARKSRYSGCIVPYVGQGIVALKSRYSEHRLKYLVMREADSDLKRYLEYNELALGQKVDLCYKLLINLLGLHSLGIYHRDIKPENIFMIEGLPVFGDLGLINFREKDYDVDLSREKIGPIGFLSPEATNKCLGLRNKSSFTFDCWIDDKSDIFQLGQVFWLVLQDEVPTGHLEDHDVKFSHPALFTTVIQPMLQYGKQRRPDAEAIVSALQPVMRDLALI